MLTQDDVYQGYLLPRGTVVLANTWAIHNDEAEYDRPDLFAPDRFLGNEYGTRLPVDEKADDHRRTSYAFGAGRRVCPGQRLAKNSLVRCPTMIRQQCLFAILLMLIFLDRC